MTNIENRNMKKIDKIVKEMIDHANNAGTVIYCGLCKNTKISYGKECLICK